ncbi:hypothetical protein SLE2022_117630 [Rubroshorea leprosula]
MESHSQWKISAKKISLEDYLDFVLTKKQDHLNIKFLNQVISMHGFRKIFSGGKKVLIDAVETLDLIDPSRSTLQSSISSSASITFEDIIADLNDLNWHECCVTSIKTLNSPKEISSSLQITDLSAPQPTSKRKPRALQVMMADTNYLNQQESYAAFIKPLNSSKECSSSLQGAQLSAQLKLKPKLKKRARANGSGDGSSSFALFPFGSS